MGNMPYELSPASGIDVTQLHDDADSDTFRKLGNLFLTQLPDQWHFLHNYC